MLKKLQKRNTEGFTIIEVMIVLAIAALILLIVLLAVPALQRNSRNTAIKNDVSAITAGVGEYASNNDGATPSTISASGSTVTIGGSGTSSTAKIQSNTTVNSTGTPGTNAGTIVVLFGQKCTNSTSFGTSGAPRSTAILYNIETSSSVAPRCTDS